MRFKFRSSLLGALLVLIVLTTACSTNGTVRVGENTFVHNHIVYRIIDTQITELGSLASDSIPKSLVLSPTLRNYETYNLDYVKSGAFTELTAVYRGDILYFNLRLNGLNDLRDRFRGGGININFIDEFGFEINSVLISMNELTRILGPGNKVVRYDYNGKAQMSREMYRAIYTYSISSSLIEKNSYGF